jgi:peroxin-7
VRLWDLRQSAVRGAVPQPVQTLQVSAGDVLAADWNKYHPGVLATAGKDRTVRVWDTRNAGRPVTELGGRAGHTSAVRKIQWSPHHADVLASCGYDMSTRVWRTSPPGIMGIMHDHSEFCMALGWALFEEGVLATGGWDQVVNVYRPL